MTCRGELVELLFFELLNEVHRISHRRPRPACAGCRKRHLSCAVLRIWRRIRQSAGFVPRLSFFFVRLEAGFLARDPAAAWVRASDWAAARLDPGVVAGNEDFRDLRPSTPAGGCIGVFQYPSEKLSSVPEPASPSPPAKARTQASISASRRFHRPTQEVADRDLLEPAGRDHALVDPSKRPR